MILEVLSQQFPICRRLRKRRKRKERGSFMLSVHFYTHLTCAEISIQIICSILILLKQQKNWIDYTCRSSWRTELEPDRLPGNLISFSYVSDALSRNELQFGEIAFMDPSKSCGPSSAATQRISECSLCSFYRRLSSHTAWAIRKMRRWCCWAFPYMNITPTRTFLLKMRVHCVWKTGAIKFAKSFASFACFWFNYSVSVKIIRELSHN